jgi:transcriptional regulator with XRE-family HTH domain
MRKARELREARGLSLREVEAMIGVDHSAISKFEQGHTGLRLVNLLAYARLLKSKVETIVQDDAEAA